MKHSNTDNNDNAIINDVEVTGDNLTRSYCQELCMRRLGGVANFLDTIVKFHSPNHFA